MAPDALLQGLTGVLAAGLSPGIEVRTEIDPATPPMLADRAQVETILLNLASNAQDAMPDGGTLTLTAHPEAVLEPHTAVPRLAPGPYVRLAVTDTGHGMPPDILARIGEPFFTTKPVGAGTGLGLAMARAFAEQSGGGIAVASTPGHGTTVTLWFPATVPGATPGQRAAGPGAAPPEPRTPAPGTRILMVDDDPMVRNALASELEDLGFHVTTLQDASTALAALDATPPPDAIVTDYAMAGMSGLELIEAIADRAAGLPIVLLTGFAEPEALARLDGIVSRRVALLRKPTTGQALADTVAQLLAAEAHPGA